jgi:hypothetical protein
VTNLTQRMLQIHSYLCLLEICISFQFVFAPKSLSRSHRLDQEECAWSRHLARIRKSDFVIHEISWLYKTDNDMNKEKWNAIHRQCVSMCTSLLHCPHWKSLISQPPSRGSHFEDLEERKTAFQNTLL